MMCAIQWRIYKPVAFFHGGRNYRQRNASYSNTYNGLPTCVQLQDAKLRRQVYDQYLPHTMDYFTRARRVSWQTVVFLNLAFRMTSVSNLS